MKRGFTLAEVLITLGIIGIIAALTLPALIADYQKKVYVAQLKKAYAVTAQAFQKMCFDEGGVTMDQTEIYNLVYGKDIVQNAEKPRVESYLKKYFNITKFCQGVSSGCHVDRMGLIYNGVITGNYPLYYGFYTTDGMFFKLSTRSVSGGVGWQDGWIMRVDVNGYKKPNRVGRDEFGFYIKNNCTIGAIGDANSSAHWKSAYNSNLCGPSYVHNAKNFSETVLGEGCAARIIENGWVMDY